MHSLLIACGASVVVELGGFVGTTTAWLASALEDMGGGTLIVSEPDPERSAAIGERLAKIHLPGTQVVINEIPSPAIIHNFPDRHIHFAWVDNDHQKHHVEQEIVALWPKMAPGGIMCFHDVWGSCDLQSVVKKYGGIALDLPRLGPAGGLGIIQVPS